MIKKNFISLYEEAFREYWDLPALTNYGGKTFLYKDIAQEVVKLHIEFEQLGLSKGDKVALMGKDSAEWCTIFLATITYGAVIVPILQDFTANDATTIIEHSEAKLLYINSTLWDKMELAKFTHLKHIKDLQSHRVLEDIQGGYSEEKCQAIFKGKYAENFNKEDIKYYRTPNTDMLLLNYTSGTTGFSKGVMVSGNNLAGNVIFCDKKQVLHRGERMLCFLPLAHTYSCSINFLFPLTIGAHVTILGRMPTPRILGKAFKEVQPNIIASVPLILEKIYQNTISPIIQKPKFKFLLKVPFVRDAIHTKIRKKLLRGLGGVAREIIIGGAALNPEVGAFLQKIGFPITVGYGMTECAPLICYSPATEWRQGSCGQVLEGYMLARISSENLEQTEVTNVDECGRPVGEIQVKGENVCLGYYKNEEETEKLFTEDGWLRTGDLGSQDQDNFLYIKGRCKTMLLSSSGQNIYPEEIESKISLLPYVLENLVIMSEGKLEALIVLNELALEEQGISIEEAWENILTLRTNLNKELAVYEQISKFKLRTEPFEKTPKQSIKRFLYQ